MSGTTIKKMLIQNNTYIVLLILIVISSLLTPYFLTSMNIRNLLLQNTGPVCMAIGMLFVILTGGIDLAVGSYMGVGVSMLAVLMMNYHLNVWPAVFLTLAAGLILGFGTGFLVAYTGMQGFIASLAMMTVARGVAYVLTNANPIRLPEGTIDILTSRNYNYPVVFIVAGIVLLFIFIQHYTTYGRLVIACGSNRNAVELAGIRVRRYITSVYMLSAVLSVCAGMVSAARTSAASPNLGTGLELNAIASCAIGGASLAGGVGSVLKTVAGVFVLALIGNVMDLLAVPPYPQDIIKGAIIILAVLMQLFTNKSEKSV